MRYVINITKNKTSKDGSILGKVLDFKNEMTLHEQSELNVYKKHPQLTACNREVTIYNRYTQQKVQTIMFGSNSYLGATIFPEAIQKAIDDNILKIYAGKTKLLISELKDADAAVLGASALGWEVRDI